MDVEAGEEGHSKGRLEDLYMGSRHVVRFSALSCRGCRERDLIFTLPFHPPRTTTAWHSTSTEETWQGQLIRPVELVFARARVLTAPLPAPLNIHFQRHCRRIPQGFEAVSGRLQPGSDFVQDWLPCVPSWLLNRLSRF